MTRPALNKLWLTFSGTSLLLAVGSSLANRAASDPTPVPPSRGFMVAFREDAPLATRLQVLNRWGLENDGQYKNNRVARLRAKAARAGEAGRLAVPASQTLAGLRREPAVRVVEPDYELSATRSFNDPGFSALWGLDNNGQGGGTPDADINAPQAWDVTTGSNQVIVAVVDTGIDYNHPDLKDNILRDSAGNVVGYDYYNGDADPMDDHSHGTHCAGTIGAVANNGLGVVGVSPNVKLMPMKFMGSGGSGPTSAAIQCIDFAVARGAKVISNSWGGDGSSQLLKEAILRAQSAGVVVVAAAGNNGRNVDQLPFYPASYSPTCGNLISVASTGASDYPSSFSNYGPSTVDIAAPGESIYSTMPGGGYGYKSGTSMAAPHVAGAAALVFARWPSLTPAEVKSKLVNNAKRVTALSGWISSGARLDLVAAVGGTNLSAPSNLVASAGDAKVGLSWTASASAASYTLKRSTSASGPFTALASGLTGLTYNDTAVQNGTSYYYVVTAVNGAAESSPSNQVSALPMVPGSTVLRIRCGGGALTAPDGTLWNADQYYTGGAVFSTGNAIAGTNFPALYQTVRYGACSYRLPAASGSYKLNLHFSEVYFSARGQRTFNVSVNGQSVLTRFDVVADAGQSFKATTETIPVTSSNGLVTVSFSNVVDSAVVCGIELIPQGGGTGPTTPAAPTGLSASAGNAKADLSWTASTGAVSYSVKRSTAAGGAYTTVASGLTATSYADSGLTNGTTYYYVVTATNTAGESGASNEASAKPVAPAVSNALRVRCGGGALTAPDGTVWNADQYYTGGAVYSTGTSITATNVPALYQTVRYGAMSYRLPATDGNYTLKLHFAEIYHTATGRRVFNVSVNGQAVENRLDVVSAAGGAFKALVETYDVQASGGAVTVSFSNVVDSAVVCGIELIPQGGTGPTTPAAPTGLSASAGNAKADLSWTASTGAVSYSVKRSITAGGAYTTVASGLTATSYADSGLTNGTTYYYVVTATNTAGESGASNEASAKPVAPAVSALRIRCGGGALTTPDGTVWGADQYFTGGQSWSTSSNISGTTTPTLYQTVRYGAMTYELPATDGNYTLKLHFAEVYFNEAGRRVFNVAVNGQSVASNLDVVGAAGGGFKALVKSYNVQASGGKVKISFTNVADSALICGIELVPAP